MFQNSTTRASKANSGVLVVCSNRQIEVLVCCAGEIIFHYEDSGFTDAVMTTLRGPLKLSYRMQPIQKRDIILTHLRAALNYNEEVEDPVNQQDSVHIAQLDKNASPALLIRAVEVYFNADARNTAKLYSGMQTRLLAGDLGGYKEPETTNATPPSPNFTQENFPHTVQDIVLSCIQAAPKELRKELCRNIKLAGAISYIKNFPERLEMELKANAKRYPGLSCDDIHMTTERDRILYPVLGAHTLLSMYSFKELQTLFPQARY